MLRNHVRSTKYEGDELKHLKRREWERCIPIPNKNYFDPIFVIPFTRSHKLDLITRAQPAGYKAAQFDGSAKWIKEREKLGLLMFFSPKELDDGYTNFEKKVEEIRNLLIKDNKDGKILTEVLKQFPRLDELDCNTSLESRRLEDLGVAFKDTLIYLPLATCARAWEKKTTRQERRRPS